RERRQYREDRGSDRDPAQPPDPHHVFTLPEHSRALSTLCRPGNSGVPQPTRPPRLSDVAGQGTPATVLLVQQKVEHSVHEYAHDPRSTSYGTEAASALDIDPGRCFKTLVAEVDGTLAVAVVPVTGSLDLKALAAALRGKRAAMADPSVAERTTGYVRGGISPLGQRKRLPTVLD